MTQRKKEGDNRRTAILEAAYTLFGNAGYANTSLKEIALQANVAQGLIIYYFNSKEMLLVEVVREWMLNRGVPDVERYLAGHTDLADLIRAAIQHAATFRNQQPEWFTLLVSLWIESRRSAVLAQELEKFYQEIRQAVRRVLQKLPLNMSSEELEALAATLQAIFDGLTLQSSTQQGDLIASYGEAGFSWLLRGAFSHK